MPTLNRKVTNHGFKEKGTSISKGSGHTLGGFKATPRLFQGGLSFINLTCQLVTISLGPHVINFYHLAQIRKIEAPLEHEIVILTHPKGHRRENWVPFIWPLALLTKRLS